jgi:hypothetical protein
MLCDMGRRSVAGERQAGTKNGGYNKAKVPRTLAILLLLSLLGLILPAGAIAQGKQQPTERSVSGIVTDENGAPISGAVVQLKNTKTLQVRSYIADAKGAYVFHGLSTDVDYELRPELNGKFGQTRTLSSFDTHAEATINLKLK